MGHSSRTRCPLSTTSFRSPSDRRWITFPCRVVCEVMVMCSPPHSTVRMARASTRQAMSRLANGDGASGERATLGKVLVLLVGIRSRSLRKWTRLQPGEHRTHIASGFRTRCERHLHEQIQSKSLTSADHRQQPDAPWRGAFPQEAIAPVVSIFPNSEHAAQVDSAADGTERPGEQMERVDIGVQGCAEVCQLLRCQAWVLVLACFVPGAFADRAAVQQVPVAFGRW